jgi:hypothetical protein
MHDLEFSVLKVLSLLLNERRSNPEVETVLDVQAK